MKQLALRGVIAAAAALAGTLGACTGGGINNGLENIPPVAIRESERIVLTAGAVGAEGIQLTDADSGAAVSIPGGTVITLDASQADDVPAVVPASIIITLRPISQFLASQNGDFIGPDGLNLGTLQKVGALAVLPVIARMSNDIQITIPIRSGTTGELSIWRFVPDDIADGDGELIAWPAVGHWRFFTSTIADGNTVTFNSDSFGQFLVTTATSSGGGGGGDNVPPTAALTAEPLTGDVPLTVAFDASASTDSDGTITGYRWDWEGDGTFDSEVMTVATTSHEYTLAGVYNPVVQVTDDDGATATATVRIVAGKVPPEITAVTPTAATAGEEVTLTVAASDPDGGPLSYAWDLDEDPETFEVDRGTDNTLVLTFESTDVPERTLRVQVTDDEGETDIFEATITVTAAETGDPQITALEPLTALAGVPTDFAVTATDDGTIELYEWDWDNDGVFDDQNAADGETPASPTFTHTFETAGEQLVGVRVTDDEGNQDSATFTVTVTEGSAGPTATLTADPDPAETGQEISFRVQTVPENLPIDSVSYRFSTGGDFVEETDETPLETAHIYGAASTYTVTVRIDPSADPTDADAFTAQTTVTVIEPAAGNQAPTAAFTATRDGSNPLLVFFNAMASVDPDGEVIDWSWDFDNDGTEDDTGEVVPHLFDAPGDYPVKLTVTDDGDPAATGEITITVRAGPDA